MAMYRESDGLKYLMEQRWENARHEFPQNKGDIIEQYDLFEKHMNEKVHPKVNEGAAASGDGILTDHGPDHVRMVIHYAYELLISHYPHPQNGNYAQEKNGADLQQRLSGYEIYILLLSIHFHDVGNIFGRDEHEKKIDEIMHQLGDKIPLDNAEKRMVRDIATAHGGSIADNPDDKDTLKPLLLRDKYGRLPVRHTLIASILRFADELSDDNSRANRFANLSETNIKFHEYSKSLYPIEFKHNLISFEFDIPYNLMAEKIHATQGDTYLYDEILKRLGKCMCELEYCRKYSDGFIKITTLNVTINVLQREYPTRCEKTLKFDLRLAGYPDVSSISIKTYLDKPSEFECDCGDALRLSVMRPADIEEAR